MAAVRPFRIEIPDSELEQLRLRLTHTRWPDRETVADWSQGIPLGYVQELCAYWATEYDWRRAERQLNAIPQLHTDLEGLSIHALHARSPQPDALPLLITHGWPGSVVEFLKVIGPLIDPEAHGGDPSDAFHVVCPSLPGFGFSDKPTTSGWGVERIARAWAELMARLGYERYGAQGGDWGSFITSALALCDPDHLVGIHTNFPLADPAALQDFGELTEQERQALAEANHYNEWDSAYAKQQSTRPQTLGYGLADSPAGQCGWIMEKFWAWTDCQGHPEHALSRDELLDNVMMYWLPGTGASSGRLYWESFRQRDFTPIPVPSGVSVFPHEIFGSSERWAATRYTDMRHYRELERGGHFAAFEQPELFVEELRTFFAMVR